MAKYFVNYDLRPLGQDYTSLCDLLERLGAFRYQQSAWLLESSMSALQLFDLLRSTVDGNDKLVVGEINMKNVATSDPNVALMLPSAGILASVRPIPVGGLFDLGKSMLDDRSRR